MNDQLTIWNLLNDYSLPNIEKLPSGSLYYTCGSCGNLVRLDKEGKAIYKVNVCKCGQIVNYGGD